MDPREQPAPSTPAHSHRVEGGSAWLNLVSFQENRVIVILV